LDADYVLFQTLQSYALVAQMLKESNTIYITTIAFKSAPIQHTQAKITPIITNIHAWPVLLLALHATLMEPFVQAALDQIILFIMKIDATHNALSVNFKISLIHAIFVIQIVTNAIKSRRIVLLAH
jgi:hypothetical protein